MTRFYFEKTSNGFVGLNDDFDKIFEVVTDNETGEKVFYPHKIEAINIEDLRKVIAKSDSGSEILCSEPIRRYEDMSQYGFLQLIRDNEGDIHIMTSRYDGEKDASWCNVEFCTVGHGGGQSKHTYQALLNLMEAMRKDNETHPQMRVKNE